MIDKQTQDQAWAALSAEFRKYARDSYNAPIECEYDEGAQFVLIQLFGWRNLTSDAEPEEVISLSRSQLIKACKCLNGMPKGYAKSVVKILMSLFGSKCLPEKLEHRLEQTSVQVDESKGEPTKEDSACIRPESESYLRIASEESHLNDSSQENRNNDNMGEKYQFGEEMFLRKSGERLGRFMFLDKDDYGDYIAQICNPENKDLGGGWLIKDVCNKKELDEQKPKRWKPAKGEKYWHLNEFMNVTSSFYDDEDFDAYTKVENTTNYFQSFELAQQAAEAVKKCLEEFHSKHNQQ